MARGGDNAWRPTLDNHALRGWATPLGVAINTIEPVFSAGGECLSAELGNMLNAVADQLLRFVSAQFALRDAAGRVAAPSAAETLSAFVTSI
jgi:hypothetical protein